MRFIALLAGALALNAGAFVTRPTPLNAGAFLTRRPVRRMAPRASAAAAGAPLLTKGHGGASTTVSVEIAEGKTITFETGVMGKQANGAVMTTCGGTIVYSTACATEDPGDFDFCPLRVDYQERFSAAGLTKGGFIKRDGRPSDDEILVSRLIDRPLRPMIAEGWTHDTQLLSWVLSYDQKTVPNPLSVCGCAAALAVSDIPLVKPVAAVQLGMHPDTLDFIVNPTREEFAVSPLNMMLAGTAEGVLMIEGEGDFLTEAQMVAAVQAAHDAVKKICAAIGELAEKTGRPKVLNTLQVIPPELKEKLNAAVGDGVASMLKMTDPEAGGQDTFVARAEMKSLTAQAIDGFAEEYGTNVVKVAFKKLCSTKMREMVRDTGRRCDGRAVDEVRPISIDVGVLPHTHGSSVFTRGETQSLATVTLGDGSMNMKGENLDGQTAKRFYLQYSFPPCSVGEVGRTGAPGRREVGHGNLAERALVPGVPKENEFPYSMRVESLITESSGSSSMASVCGGSLALMDAGVPMSRVIAGVAMGLILDEDGGDDEPLVLTDILGIEDGLGTMDFKVAGDESGISTFQLDIKCEGLAVETLERALEQARQGRLHILEQMQAALPGPRTELPSTVPKMISLAVPVSSIGKVIGPGGKTIRAIIEDFELQGLDVGEEGAIAVSGFNVTKMEQAKAFIEKMTAEAAPKPSYDGPFPEEGRIFRKCEVVSVKNFGVFVSLGDEFPGLEGLVHVSELHTERIRNINGFVKEGQRIDVKCLGMADGKLKLSRKAVFETAAAGK